MKHQSKKLVAVSIAVASLLIASFLIVSTAQHSADTTATTTPTSSNTVYFTIIESDRGAMEGMNGSAYHLYEPWPVMEVQMGDIVIIHIESMNSSEVHGFAIVHYFDPGVGLLPGGSYTDKFVANENGTFLVSCLIFCAIHYEMDHGELIVDTSEHDLDN